MMEWKGWTEDVWGAEHLGLHAEVMRLGICPIICIAMADQRIFLSVEGRKNHWG